MSMEYYKFSDGDEFLYVRTAPDAHSADYFDTDTRRWIRNDVYFTEIYSNGGGEDVTEAEALAAIGLLQSA